MNGDAGILKQRVHALAVQRRVDHALERVRRQKDEQKEAERNQPHHPDNTRQQAWR